MADKIPTIMTPEDVYNKIIASYPDTDVTSLCNLHSACSPRNQKTYLCGKCISNHPNTDFDAVAAKFAEERGIETPSSVDALSVAPSKSSLCFMELKSWVMVDKYAHSETGRMKTIHKKVNKYSTDIPKKLTESVDICKQITSDNLEGIDIHLILATDIDTSVNGLGSLVSNLNMLTGSAVSSIGDWRELCNTLFQGILNGIKGINTHYWHCRDFDTKIASL